MSVADSEIVQPYNKHFIPLESNPDVFTELAHELGLSTSLGFEDVLSIDDRELLGFLPRPALALILVFPTTGEYEKRAQDEDATLEDFHCSGSVVFFRQTINNACGLYAILHAICNGEARQRIDDVSIIGQLLDASPTPDSDELAQALERNTGLEVAYAGAASKGDTEAPLNAEDEVDYHYVAFVKSSKDNHVYQLDGDRKRPIDLGALTADEDILSEKCLGIIRGMMAKENDNLNFSLMALVEQAGM
ncbi:ubiquitin carboxyl-terminal hydrolase L3 [Alternaria panax]|uniref:Ubiquitin carboxyl-terminal hydrolase n=1 Tax=Alternaria panax TaxID=48097 RepID=A0AAD4IEI8_9PLEO|nr:ubiquitin carboxyl-terminal hydrolase L3 [Alternaria panax]